MGQVFSASLLSTEKPASDKTGASLGELPADHSQPRTELDSEWAQVRRDEAISVGEQLLDEVKRLNALLEAECTARRQQHELGEAVPDGVGQEEEDAERAREVAARAEAEEERERSRRTHEDAEWAIAAAKDEAERAQKAAEDREAEETTRAAAEQAQRATSASQEGTTKAIQPVVVPSPEELAAARRRIQYRDDCFHFVVAGEVGSGKSSLINAFRGLRSTDPGAAPAVVTETPHQITRFPNADPENPFVWYITGTSTLKCPDWKYFSDQGLYVFDCIILLFNSRFSTTDLAILVNARRFNIPTFIVRSDAERRIKRIMSDMGYNSDEDAGDVERRTNMYDAARKRLVEGTRKWVRRYLEAVNLPDQRVYIVSNSVLSSIVQNRTPKRAIDEVELLNDLFNQPYTRRVATARSDEMIASRMGSWSRG